MKRTMQALAAAALTALALAGCGTTHSASGPSEAAASPSAATPSANVQACQDFAKQLAWLEARKATVTLVDIATFGGWLQMDSGDSTGKLHADMAALSAGDQNVISGSSASPGNLVVPVALDCAALGVSVKPAGS